MKLSKIKFTQILFKASREDLNNIILDKNTCKNYIKTDIGILLTNRVDAIHTSINLCKLDIIKKILIASNNYESIEDYIFNNGIPRRDLIPQPNGNNLISKIDFSLELLSRYYDLDEISLSLIVNDYNLKRCKGITNKLLKNILTQHIDITTDGLHNRILLCNEALEICNLAKEGYIEDTDIKQLTFNKQ